MTNLDKLALLLNGKTLVQHGRRKRIMYLGGDLIFLRGPVAVYSFNLNDCKVQGEEPRNDDIHLSKRSGKTDVSKA